MKMQASRKQFSVSPANDVGAVELHEAHEEREVHEACEIVSAILG